MHTKLEHALRLARLGFYIFRLAPNSKLPLKDISWPEVSTRNENTIRGWFTDEHWDWEPDFNIAIDCAKSGLLVIDVDCKEGKRGLETLKKLLAERPLPETYTVHTPSGGVHFYFISDRFRNTAGELGEGIDTRGDGGYVVAAGSSINGKEYLEEDLCFGDIPPLPAAWCELLSSFKGKPVQERQSDVAVSVDDAEDVRWAIKFLQEHEPAIQGAAGDHHTFVTFCKLKERGISCATAIDLADEYWNPRCSPPWDLPDLTRKAQSAYKSAQNATGAQSLNAEFDLTSIAEPPKQSLLAPRRRKRGLEIPARQWVFGNLCMRKQVTIFVAPGGSGKSTLTLSLAISKASGKNIIGHEPCGAGRVAVYNNEDNADELDRRAFAILQHFNIKDEDVDDNLILLSGENRPLRIAKRGDNSGRLKPADVEALIDAIKTQRIEILIVDPFAETHPAKENENEEMLEIGRMYRAVAQLADCAVVLVHHTRKLAGASSEGHSGNLDAMRGASSLGGLARVVATFDSMNRRQARDYGIPEDIAHRYTLLEVAKSNMAAKSAARTWYEWKSETINATLDNPDGERVGVIDVVKLGKIKEAVDDATSRMMNDIQTIVEEAPQTIPTIAATLVGAYPFYGAQRAQTLEKAIRRTFNGNSVMLCLDGTLHLDEPLHGAKMIRFNRLRFNGTDEPELLLL